MVLGYLAPGPDYFGDSAPSHKPDRDLQAWLSGSRKPVIDVFPAWLDTVNMVRVLFQW